MKPILVPYDENMTKEELLKAIADAVGSADKLSAVEDEPQKIGYCNECKWYGDKQVCGRCRSRNLYAPKDEPQIFICPIQNDYEALIEDEPQTDCAWGKDG